MPLNFTYFGILLGVCLAHPSSHEVVYELLGDQTQHGVVMLLER